MREPAVGDRLDQYQLIDLLARSGMASIFKAIDSESGQAVALKVPHVQYEADIVFSERFRREEEAGQQLDHPNVVRILKPREKSAMYMAMEYVEGKSLRALMDGKHPLPADKALDIARQLLDALQYLHDHGVVHRDIKPENLLLTADGTVKILDFGIALFVAERRLTWQGLSHTIGTPDYMAPEQIRGRRGDPRTDVYAVGTLLYEMLTCHLPYESSNPRALLRAKTSEEPRPPAYHVPGFDPHLEAIILRAIERDPRDRYGSARQMLADVLNPAGVPPRDPETGAARRRARAAGRRRTLLGVTVAAVVVALGMLLWLTERRSAPPPAEGAPPNVRAR
ncbi:MAG TPA: serine/threonine-protein kinase [Anaeromyxobacteraceae bacterium]|nr:serine/threonine-protein kinase [Anaeromyxobacteraceae bacterium]